MFNFFKPKRIYLDYAAATPVSREVLNVMRPFWTDNFGNPGGIHAEGVASEQAVDDARTKVARTLRVRSSDIFFTSGGTEGNALALRGTVKAMREAGVTEIEIISLKTEHPSVLRTLEALEKDGCTVIYAPIDQDGLLILPEFEKLLSHRTRLVSIAYANSETGVVQDITRISRTIKAFEKENGIAVLLHSDACQAPLWLSCAVDSLGVDLLTLDAGKCNGPKGIGILVKRPRAMVSPLSLGGDQEEGIRPGTEPVPLIVGAALALEIAQNNYEKRGNRVAKLRKRFIKALLNIPGLVINGSIESRLPNNVNLSVPGLDTEFAVVTLDRYGIAASTKSACAGHSGGQSHVVFAMTEDLGRSSSTLRFTLGPDTIWRDLKKTAITLRNHIENTPH